MTIYLFEDFALDDFGLFDFEDFDFEDFELEDFEDFAFEVFAVDVLALAAFEKRRNFTTAQVTSAAAIPIPVHIKKFSPSILSPRKNAHSNKTASGSRN